MKHFLPLFTALLLFSAHAVAITDSRVRDISGFNALNVKDCFEVHFSESDSFRVYIDTLDGEILSRTLTTVANGTLNISYDGNRIERIRVLISAPQLLKIDMSGVSSFIAETDLNMPSAHFSVSGTGSLTLRSLTTTIATVHKSGIGSFVMDGALVCDSLIGEIEGAGSMKLNSITSIISNISTSGTCVCDIKGIVSTGKFIASMNVAGSINITGDIQAKENVWLEMNGTGSVKVTGHIYARNLNVRLKGLGSITTDDIQVDKVNVLLKGAGKVLLAGTANEINQDKAALGTIDTEKLRITKK